MSRILRWTACILFTLLLSSDAVTQTPAELFSSDGARNQLTAEQTRRYEQYKSLRSTTRIRAADLLAEPMGAKALRLNFFPGDSYQAVVSNVERRADGGYTWRGTIRGMVGQVILVARDGRVTGWVWVSRGPEGERFFSISPVGGRTHVLRETNQEWFDSVSPWCTTGEKSRTATTTPLTATLSRGETGARAIEGRASASASAGASSRPAPAPQVSAVRGGMLQASAAKIAALGCKVNVLVVYTPSAQSAHGDIPGLAQLAVEQTNGSYSNSQISNLSLNLVGAAQVNYSESGSKTGTEPDDLLRLRNPTDGFMDEVHALRSELGADIVVLFVHNLTALGGLAGGSSQGPVAADMAFAVVDWEFAVDNLSFAHELGHLMGARHHYEADDTETPYKYGHGSCRDWPYKYKTIMGVVTCKHPRVPYWSNPDVKYKNRATGDGTYRNNARVLKDNACRMADLTSALMGWNPRWINGGSHKINWWSVNPNDRYAVGDFDGDGVDELLAVNPNGWAHLMKFDGTSWNTPWINGGGGAIHWWRIGPSDNFVAGDFLPGNNRDELLAVNPAGGYAHMMVYDGANWTTPWVNGGNGVIDSWRLRGVDRWAAGDFIPGNGRDELLAVNPTGYAHLMKFDGASWSTPWANWGNGIMGSWRIRYGDSYVAGDFLAANGRDELLALHPSGYAHLMANGAGNWTTPWHNGGGGAINWWLIGGSDLYVPGDFLPGDGRDELLAVALNNGWSHLLSHTSSAWQTPWINLGAGNIGWWLIGSADRYLAGKFIPGDQRDILLSIQPLNGWVHLHSR